MQITITPTETITHQGTTPLRIWKGTDDEGNPVVALVEAVARTDVDVQVARGPLRFVEGNDKPNVSGLEAVPYHRALKG